MNADERNWERLWSALDDPRGLRQVYVYALGPSGRPKKGYIWKGDAWSHLPEFLRDEFGGGEFRVLIRLGRRMVYSGDIAIAPPPRC